MLKFTEPGAATKILLKSVIYPLRLNSDNFPRTAGNGRE